MKKILMIPAMAAFLLMGCADKQNKNATPNSNTSASAVVTSGKWVVSYFYDNDKDETSDYNGLVFEFRNDKTIAVERSGNVTNGTWNEITDDGLQKFVINLNTTDDKLTELNDDWVIESKSTSQLKLKDDNPDRDEQLHFTKQ